MLHKIWKYTQWGNSILHFQDTIDTYDFATGTENINVTQLPDGIRHHACVLIKGNEGHPTVAMCND